MEQELIDILTIEGKKTGNICLKSEIHTHGHYHNTVHIWFYDTDGHILLAQRSAKKELYPLLWDVSVAGHVDAGETLKEAAVREIREESNLVVKKKHLQKIGVFESFRSYDTGITDNEFHHTYICDLKTTWNQLTPAIDEVEAFKLVSFAKFRSILEHIGVDNHFVATNKTYYQTVFDAIVNQKSEL